MIICKYEEDGEITGLDNVNSIEDSVLSGDLLELTQIEKVTYLNTPTNCGIIDGVFSNTWEKLVPPELLEVSRVRAIKRKASAIILAKIPNADSSNWVEKELNLLARNQELMDILIQGGSLSATEQLEYTNNKALWAEIKAIRLASNIAESDGTLEEDFNP